MKEYRKHEPEIVCWLSNYKTSLHNHQKIQKRWAFEVAGYERQGRKHAKVEINGIRLTLGTD
jgi:hypothetical protein